MRPPGVVSVRITPRLRVIMCRATACAAMNCARAVERDGLFELRKRGLRERLSLDVRDADGVEHDVDAAGLRRYRVGMALTARSSKTSSGAISACRPATDVARNGRQFRLRATGEKYPGAFAREHACGCAADGAATAVDHRGLVG